MAGQQGGGLMSRAWLYDRQKEQRFRDSVARAQAAKRKPPARWQVRYYDPAGHLRTEALPTRQRADARRTELESTLRVGGYVDPASGKVLLGDMAESWLASRHDLRPSTWWKYRGLLDNHVIPKWGEHAVRSIHNEDIALWVASLLKSKDKGGSGLGPSQARHAFRVLSMALEWCVPRRLVANPARGVTLPIQPDAEHVYLSCDQVEALADAASRLRTKYDQPTASSAVNRALILVLAYTGMRWGEAAALRVGRFDLEARRIRVAVTFTEVAGKQLEGLPKTGKRRTVPIPRSLVAELKPLIDDRPDEDFVFTTKRGDPLRPSNWRRREFDKAVDAAGLVIPGLTPHKLRHTAASLAIAAGADVKVLQQMLGHADASMTLNTYGHLWPDRLDEVADTLDGKRAETLKKRQEKGPRVD
jgi:integrase